VKIVDLIKNSDKPFYSLEFFPPKEAGQMPDFFQTASRLKALAPLFVSVTYGAGGSRDGTTLDSACVLKDQLGCEPMTQLTGVGSRRTHLAAYLEKLRLRGIDNILALRGDAPKPVSPDALPYDWSEGEFLHASDLVAFIRESFPDFCIGVAGYPAPHPESSSLELDRAYTVRKVRAGGDFLVTQLFFAVREYVDFVADMRRLGVEAPVLPGVMPVQSLESLKYILSLCGARLPADYAAELEAVRRRGGAEAVRELGIRYAAGQVRDLLKAGAPGVHLYTLNKFETCLKIAELAAGCR
jgi:methylenetetrahydrofolate reductase (NADPH)